MHHDWTKNDNIQQDSSGGYYQANNKTLVYYESDALSSAYHVQEGTIEIGEKAFSGVGNLKKIILPDSIRIIRKMAFENCNELKHITLPERLEIIEESTFHRTALESIHIPASVRKIGKAVFAYCSNLKRITVNSTNPFYRSIDGVLVSKSNHLISYPSGYENVTYQIPDTIVRVAEEAFIGTTQLQKIIFNNQIKHIRKFAFAGCSALKEIVLPQALKKIGKGAFIYCLEIENITLPDGIEIIEDSAFYYCNKLKKINIPLSLIKIGKDAFTDTSNIDFIIDDHHPRFRIIDGEIFEKRSDVYEKDLHRGDLEDMEKDPF